MGLGYIQVGRPTTPVFEEVRMTRTRIGKLRPDRQEYFLAGFAAHFLRTYVRVASA